MKTKQTFSVGITPEAKRLLRELAQVSGVSMTAVIELVIRAQARQVGLRVSDVRPPVCEGPHAGI